MFDQILDWETPTQKRQVGLDFKTHLRRLLAFTFLHVFFKYTNIHGRSLERGGCIRAAAAGGQQQLRRGRGGRGGGAGLQGRGQVQCQCQCL